MSVNPPYEATAQTMAYGRHTLQKQPACCHGSILGYDPEALTVKVIPVTCGRWSCPDCAPRKAADYAARLFRAGPERHIVLTWNPAVSNDPAVALARMKKALPKLIEQLRGPIYDDHKHIIGYENTFEYCCIWERHASGFPHIHLAQWGHFCPQAKLRAHWEKLTGARIVYIKAMNSSEQGGHHWTKYLLKAIGETSIYLPGMKLVTFSRNYNRNPQAELPTALGAKTVWAFIRRHPGDILDALVLAYGAYNEDNEHEDVFKLTRPLPFSLSSNAASEYFDYDNARRMAKEETQPIPQDYRMGKTIQAVQTALTF